MDLAATAESKLSPFFTKHCIECHDADTKKGGLEITSLPPAASSAENFARWVKVHDRIASGEIPPKKKAWSKTARLNATPSARRVSDFKRTERKTFGLGKFFEQLPSVRGRGELFSQ